MQTIAANKPAITKSTMSGGEGSLESEQLHSGLKKIRIGEDERGK